LDLYFRKYLVCFNACIRVVAVTLGFLALSSGNATAQQPSILSQYMFVPMIYNPAYAGSSGGICASGLFREQWIGFKDSQGNKGAPQVYFVTVDAPIKKLHGAVSGSVSQDKIGAFSNIGVNLGYAYRADLGPGEFSVGAQLLLENIKLDFSKFQDQIIDDGDWVFKPTGDESDLTVDFSLGLWYQVPDKYYIGLSAGPILESSGKNTYYTLRRTYFLNGGYTFTLPGNPKWEIQPNVMFQYDGGAFQGNLTAIVTYNKKFWGGVGYRYQDAVILLAGADIKGFKVGISYDISTSQLTNYNSGSVEVMLGYCFKIETDKFRKRYKNTRFL
jgi:type IX secretion system PorP/SprF family membrane protein